MTQYSVFLVTKKDNVVIRINNTKETVEKALIWLLTNAVLADPDAEIIDFGYEPIEVEPEDRDFEEDHEEHLRQRYGR